MCVRTRCRVPGSTNAVSRRRRRWLLASPIQRARKPASPPASACLDLLEQPTLLDERGSERLAVVEEDVDPDPRVGAADARHVPERAARCLERVVPVDACGARLVEEDVREHVRQVARHRDEAVVGIRADRNGSRAERRDEPVHEPEAVRLRRRGRREEPRRAVEEIRRRALRPARLRAADRMPADEPPVASRGGRDGPLRRSDVRHGGPLGRAVERLAHDGRKLADRRRDEDEVRRGDGLGDAPRRLHGAPLRGDAERVGIGIPAGHRGHARTLGGEPGGRADQTGSDDRQTLGRCHQPVLVAAGSPVAIMQPASARRRGTRHRATAAR